MPDPTLPTKPPSTSATTASDRDLSISTRIARQIGAQKYRMWFSQTSLQVEGGRMRVATDSQFVADWIGIHFSGALSRVAREAIGDRAEVDIRVAPEMFGRADRKRNPEESTSAPPAPSRTSGSLKTAPRPTPGRTTPYSLRTFRHLKGFVVGVSNKLAYAAAQRIAEGDDDAMLSPLFIHGDCGLGKTHLLQGVCRRFIERTHRPNRVRYVTGEQFTNEYIASVRNSTVDDFRRRYRKLDLLVIDDIHFLANKTKTQNEFLHTIDTIGLTGARIVLASDEHPGHIKRFSHALVSRFLSGMVAQIGRPDRAMRLTLIRRVADDRGVHLNPAAADLIADRCMGSVREIEGAVTKLAALYLLIHDGNGKNEIGPALAEQIFSEQGWCPSAPVRATDIIDAVCTRLGVSRPDLLGSGRHQRIVLARAMIAYLARELTTLSFPEIARALGRRHHSTIHTADQRLRRQLEAGQTVDLGRPGAPVTIRELGHQLRHEIIRGAGRG